MLLDQNGDERVSFEEMKQLIDVKRHPDVLHKERTAPQVPLQQLLLGGRIYCRARVTGRVCARSRRFGPSLGESAPALGPQFQANPIPHSPLLSTPMQPPMPPPPPPAPPRPHCRASVGETSSTPQCLGPTAGPWWKNHFYCVRVAQLSHSSQVLLLPVGAPPMLVPACYAQSLSQDGEIWRVLTTTDVGSVKQGQGFRFAKRYPSVVRRMPSCLRYSPPVCSMQWVCSGCGA